jgi:uridine phosphorylase
MKKIGTTLSGTVIVEMTAVQYDALAQIHAPAAAPSTPPVTAKAEVLAEVAQMSPADRVAFVRERISKLRPKKKEGVVRSIAAMFQFTGGIEEREVSRVIVALQKMKFFYIDADGRVTYTEA